MDIEKTHQILHAVRFLLQAFRNDLNFFIRKTGNLMQNLRILPDFLQAVFTEGIHDCLGSLLADARKLDPGKIADDPLFFIRKRTFHRLDGELHAVFRMFDISPVKPGQDICFDGRKNSGAGDDFLSFILKPELHHGIHRGIIPVDDIDDLSGQLDQLSIIHSHAPGSSASGLRHCGIPDR